MTVYFQVHRRSHGPPGHATVIPVTPLRRACGAWDTETSADPGAVITYNHYIFKHGSGDPADGMAVRWQ